MTTTTEAIIIHRWLTSCKQDYTEGELAVALDVARIAREVLGETSFEQVQIAEVVAWTSIEGGTWAKFEAPMPTDFLMVHAIKFSDGRIWDIKNGWRE